jgi:pimeloyl-ACP methyl ester carboxylesterase
MIERVSANGLDFAYLADGTGPLVLLLHGFPDTAHTWDRTRPALAAAGFRAVSPFMRGYAPTAVPADGDYGADALARDAAALITALGEERAIVVGHDWGASAAYGVANLFPERVRFLVTLAIPHPASLIPTPWGLWRARHFFSLRRRNAAALMRANDFAHVDELVRRWSPAWKVPPGETDAVKKVFAEPACLEAALGYYRALGPILPRSQRDPIRMAAVAFAGATDGVLAPPAFERARRHYRDQYEVVTLPGGHFLHREHPDAFHAALVTRLPTR